LRRTGRLANCPIKDCNWKGKKSGLPIHLARMHHIRRDYDSETIGLASESNVLASESKCPVPGCGQEAGDLESHLSENHQDWRLSSGKWVFEV
jgi:hypothetical protein